LSETPTITAIGNDTDFSNIFKLQLEKLMSQGDVFIGISCSGTSPNIVKAMEYANSRNGQTIAITGFDGGKIADIANYVIHIRNKSFEQLEDIHLVVCHILALCVRKHMGWME
jgi:D-sedoheptulose 7-phosphate isomerase